MLPLVDQILDRTIVFSYTKVGYHLRRPFWSSAADQNLQGMAVLVTGANRGLGYATVARLLERGATVHLGVRDLQRGERACQRLRERTGSASAYLHELDMGDLASIRSFAQSFRSRGLPLHCLIHNAGALLAERQVSAEGLEMTLATHVVGPFLLTYLILPVLQQCAPSRVIFVTSGGLYAQRVDLDDLQWQTRPYDGVLAYAQAKRAQAILTEQWALHIKDSGVTVNAMHPGWVDTTGVERSLPRFYRLTKPLLRTPDQGADTIVWLATSPEIEKVSGSLWFDRRQRPMHLWRGTQQSPEEKERLWLMCQTLAGVEGLETRLLEPHGGGTTN